MEGAPQRIWQFQQHSSPFSEMVCRRIFPKTLEKGLVQYDDVAGRNRIFVQIQDILVKNHWKLCEIIAMSLISVREKKKKLRYRTDSKHVAGLWRLSPPGSINCGNCLSDMKRQIGHRNHRFNLQPVLSLI